MRNTAAALEASKNLDIEEVLRQLGPITKP